VSETTHRCPACGRILDGPPLRCSGYRWHLSTLEAWEKLAPFDQGFALYMQGSWPMSEIADQSNPYAQGSTAWDKFRQGEALAVQEAQDGEE